MRYLKDIEIDSMDGHRHVIEADFCCKCGRSEINILYREVQRLRALLPDLFASTGDLSQVGKSQDDECIQVMCWQCDRMCDSKFCSPECAKNFRGSI